MPKTFALALPAFLPFFAPGFVGLSGVQSNQFPRALDLARQFRAAAIPVAIGGFHVSGCVAMLPELIIFLRWRSYGVAFACRSGYRPHAGVIRA